MAAHCANPFHERFVVEAAARRLAHDGVRLHLHSAGTAEWNSILPLRQVAETPLGSAWSIWDHVHAMDTTPGDSRELPLLLDSLFGFLRERRARVLRWPTLPADTQFHARLVEWLDANRLACAVTKSVRRPVLQADAPAGAAAIACHVGGKRMRELRRIRRRLEELGKVGLRIHDGPHDARAWMDDFLAIERSGWKGGAGTALACRPHEHAWFETVSLKLAAEGRLLAYALELDGEPVAMSVNFRVGSKVWCFKTAYRADLSRNSPGVLLEYESTMAALADPTIEWMDACTEDDTGLMGTLWPDRRPVVDLLISTHPAFNRAVRSAAAGWRAYLAVKRFRVPEPNNRSNRGPK